MKVSDEELNLLKNEYHFGAVVAELLALRKVADAAAEVRHCAHCHVEHEALDMALTEAGL